MHDGIIVAFPAQRTAKAKAPLPCSATIVDFSGQKSEAVVGGKTRKVSEIANNEALRAKRKKAWNRANLRTRFLQSILRFDDMIHICQRAGLPEAKAYEDRAPDQRNSILCGLRAAVEYQLFTPAPDLAAEYRDRIDRPGTGGLADGHPRDGPSPRRHTSFASPLPRAL